MLCTDCKRTFPKWKLAGKPLCLPCIQKRRRESELLKGNRPEAQQVWRDHKQSLEEEKHNKEKDAITAWLEH